LLYNRPRFTPLALDQTIIDLQHISIRPIDHSLVVKSLRCLCS
jgi:hypothetical protein